MLNPQGLIADLLDTRSNTTRQNCSFTRIKNNMSEEERSAVEKAENAIRQDTGNGRAKAHSYKWLSDVLTKNGYPVSASTISRHMTGGCGCE